ncbi:MAG: DUF5107 domain-containing protein [Armatimonadetes bacterium]|nr:DUF5107 domain-containing protein [Armatimonadota bacterium]
MSVRAWQNKIGIPTYPLGPEDPNPPFQRQNSSWAVYPYPLQDDVLEGPPSVRKWVALHLENDFLHCIVLPELGGHLYSLYDKVCKREVFYRNNVIKYGLVATRGAWISGGIEFNFPMGHTYTTVDAVSWSLEQWKDSAQISIENTCRVSRMEWVVDLLLYEGERALHEQVTLTNPMPYKQRYWFWNNSAVPARDDLRLVYPARKARVSGGIVDYPVKADGTDISRYTAHDHADDIFTLDVREDYFGCHYDDIDFGMVHVADRHEMQGKKYFTWGTGDDGMIWVDLLTDEDGQYVEIQSGRYETQSIWEFIQPNETVRLDSVWMPEHGMGGWVCADEGGILNFQLIGDQIRVGALTTTEFEGAVLALTHNDVTVWSAELLVGPRAPFAATIPLPEGAGPDSRYRLELTHHEIDGPIIAYKHPPWHMCQPKVAETGEDKPRQPPSEEHANCEELCVLANSALKRLEHSRARDLFTRVLSIDPGFSQAHIGLGLLDIRSAKYEDAIAHLEEATFRNPDCAEGWHLLGVARRRAGDLLGAEDALARSMRTMEGHVYSFPELMATIRDQEGPGEMLDPGVLPYGIASGHALLTGDLFLPPPGITPEQGLRGFIKRCRGDVERWLEYAVRQEPRVAVRVMELALEHCPGASNYPMTQYVLAWFYEKLGEKDRADRAFERAAACPVDFCFPSRLEEVPVLARAIEANPSDWKARYLYGNLLASLDRGEDAMAQWRAALEIDDSFAVLHRNLAYGSLAWEDNAEASATHYRNAIARNPQDYRYYLSLIQVMGDKLGASDDELWQVLASSPPEVRSKWQIAGREAELLVRLERFDEALALLTSHRYFPWEGAHHMRGLWTDCLSGRARKHAESGDHRAALADLELALTYPRNLGVGKRSRDSDALLYWLAAEQAGAVGDAGRRSQLLEAAAAEPHGHNRDADWWQLLALRELGRTDEASALEAELRAWAEEHRDHPRAGATARTILDRLAE